MGRAMRRLVAGICIAGAGGMFGAPGGLARSSTAIPPLPTEGTRASAAAAVNDPGTPLQWGLELIGVADGWRVSTGTGITIAIVDSGADVEHEDLVDRITADGTVAAATCLDTDGDVKKCIEGQAPDDDGHGTHVAGVAAATRDNGKGMSGVAPGAALLIVKVLKQHCTVPTTGVSVPGPIECRPEGTAPDVSAGIRYAVDHGADVINLSVGSLTQSLLGPSFADALQYAWSKGVIAVVAAGNEGGGASGFTDQPAIVVGAVNRGDTKASKANGVGNARWSLTAPGGEEDTAESCRSDPNGILSTYWVAGHPNAYACLPGTSAAAPHVAGAAAILRSAGLTPQQTVDRLLSTARDLGPVGFDTTYGSGLLDISRAVAGLPGSGTPEPSTTTSTAPGSTTTVTEPAPPVETTQPPETTPSTAPPVIQLDVQQPVDTSDQESLSNRRSGELPTTPVIAAVMLALTMGCAAGWLLMRGAGWARRTPPP